MDLVAVLLDDMGKEKMGGEHQKYKLKTMGNIYCEY